MNQAIHNVDLLQWLMGDVASVQAMTAMLVHERIEVEDTAVTQLHRQRDGVPESVVTDENGLVNVRRSGGRVLELIDLCGGNAQRRQVSACPRGLVARRG